MSDETIIRVNFGKPMPVFPVPMVALLPHGVLPLYIVEERYHRMVVDALAGQRLIAVAVFEAPWWPSEDDERDLFERPALKPAVCVGHIVHHDDLGEGRHRVAIQGVCRARIVHELPEERNIPYRRALLHPIGVQEQDEERLTPVRDRLETSLSSEPLTDLRDSRAVVEHLGNTSIPTSAILELIALSFVSDQSRRYQLLAEGDAAVRAGIIEHEMNEIARLLRLAAPQREIEWPKGCSWN